MPKKPSFSRGHQEQALNLLRDGGSYEDVAKEFEVQPDTIYRLAKRRNVEDRKKRDTGKNVSFYLTNEEFLNFEALVKTHGYRSRSELGRALIRGALGFLEVSDGELQGVDEIKKQMSAIGSNVNQMARKANSGRMVLGPADKDDLNDLRFLVDRLNLYLEAVIDEMRRRNTQLWRKSEYRS